MIMRKKTDCKKHREFCAEKEVNMVERRRFIRFNTPVSVEYRTLTLNPIFGKALAKDLSREGIRFGMESNVPMGTPLEIYLSVPGDNLPVFAVGKVAWADGLEAGIKLTRITEGDRTRVLSYVYNQWVKARKKIQSAAN